MMLVQIGDVWVDPERVEAVRDGAEVTFDVPVPAQGLDGGFTWHTTAPHTEWRVDPEQPCATLYTEVDEYVARGVTGAEAVQIVNRCREARLGRRG